MRENLYSKYVSLMAIIHHFDWKTFNTNNNICLRLNQRKGNMILPSGAGAPAERQSASGPWPGRCSCRPGRVQIRDVSGTLRCPHTSRHTRSTYTVLKFSTVIFVLLICQNEAI